MHLHSLERTTAGIGLHVNAHKTEYMCYNQTGDISTLDGTSRKLVDKFNYLGSSLINWKLHKNVASNIEQVLVATPHKAPTIRPLASHHENYPS